MRGLRRASCAIAGAVVLALAAPANAEPGITSGEAQWIHHLRSIVGVQITDEVAAANTGRTICALADNAPDTDTALAMIDQFVAEQFVNTNPLQRNVIAASALRMVCPAPPPQPYPTEDESFIRTCMGKTGQTREQCIADIQEGVDSGTVRVP
jgi:hypothetical protein